MSDNEGSKKGSPLLGFFVCLVIGFFIGYFFHGHRQEERIRQAVEKTKQEMIQMKKEAVIRTKGAGARLKEGAKAAGGSTKEAVEEIKGKPKK